MDGRVALLSADGTNLAAVDAEQRTAAESVVRSQRNIHSDLVGVRMEWDPGARPRGVAPDKTFLQLCNRLELRLNGRSALGFSLLGPCFACSIARICSGRNRDWNDGGAHSKAFGQLPNARALISSYQQLKRLAAEVELVLWASID